MPNHIANFLTLSGNSDRVAKAIEFVKSNESPFDFDCIVPMPDTFKEYDTTNHADGRQLTIGKPIDPFVKDSPIVTEELIEAYKRETRRQRIQYGVVGWYDWHCRFWGTKWNAYDVTRDGNQFTFYTAWSAPLPVIRKLAEIFPDIEIVLTYADEDYGYNCGHYTFYEGRESSYLPIEGSDEAMELYFETHPDEEDNFIKNENGDWEYR